MLNVLINAYAVNPDWGSEQGMGWNWIVNIARYCHVDVITEGEFRANIDAATEKLDYRDNIQFHYLPVTDKVRKMCWNQGDWRFYGHYKKWQRRALAEARSICTEKKIDILHQLNMIGFREPGYLWQIPDIPFVWGPIGGMELMPMAYLNGAPLKQRIFNSIKNLINKLQYTYSPRVKSALNHANARIAAVKGVQDVIRNVHHKDSILINETGVDISPDLVRRQSRPGTPLKVIWVGKFDFRKQLPLAIQSVIAANRPDIELHICGSGSDSMDKEMKLLAESGGIVSQCHWHGNIPNNEVKRMMADCDLMLFTSIMEATSTVVLEAISVGLPVLSFNTCGFGPIVKDFAGITVEISSPIQSIDDFAKQLQRVHADRNLLNSISDSIMANRESLTWHSKAIRLQEIYQTVCGNHSK